VPMNILFLTLDQFRGDALSCAGHPVVRTPHLDALAAEGVRFARHYAQASPCGPGRASLYTGLYQMNHRVVANGTPLDTRFDTVAKAARRAGYAPALFGYTDQSLDPRLVDGPGDPRLSTYEGVLDGFDPVLHLPMGAPEAWIADLRAKGHAVDGTPDAILAGEPARPAADSMAAFVADRFLDWSAQQTAPWFAHVSQLRPHPPYAAAGAFARLYDPAAMPPPIAPSTERHALHAVLVAHPALAAPADPAAMAALKAQYFGMVSEADHQLGRIIAGLKAQGAWENTFVVVTADHGEQLGDHGLIEKLGFFEASFHIPAIIRDPREWRRRGGVVTDFTEAVDILPTLCEAMGLPVPLQCDGLPLTPFLEGRDPPWWRTAAHWEFDWRFSLIPLKPFPWPWDRTLERQALAVRRSGTSAYVHLADGGRIAFDLGADPTWRPPLTDPERLLADAEAMLAWRTQHLDRTLASFLCAGGGMGRWPEGSPGSP